MNKRYKRSGESLFIKTRHQEEKHFSSAPQKKFSMTKEYKSVLGTHKVKINYYQSEEKDTERGRERVNKVIGNYPKCYASYVGHGWHSVIVWSCMAAYVRGSPYFISDVTGDYHAGMNYEVYRIKCPNIVILL